MFYPFPKPCKVLVEVSDCPVNFALQKKSETFFSFFPYLSDWASNFWKLFIFSHKKFVTPNK